MRDLSIVFPTMLLSSYYASIFLMTLISAYALYSKFPLFHWKRLQRLFSANIERNKTQYILKKESSFSDTIKKSKFVATALPASSIDEALKVLGRVSDTKATHNCWAFNSVSYQRYSDDGEPSGTAGRPILNALTAEGVVDTIVVCTRYYGGINLGTGGLARAYGGTALQALKNANKVEYVPMQLMEVEINVQDLGAVHHVLKSYEVEQLLESSEQYSVSNAVILRTRVPVQDVLGIQDRISSSLGGRGKVTIVGT